MNEDNKEGINSVSSMRKMKGDKRFVLRLVLVLALTTLLSLLIYSKIMNLNVGGSAVNWFDAVAPLETQ